MILVDTSVWVDHLRRRDDRLAQLLDEGMVLCHPFVIGELALGSLKNRAEVLALLGKLPSAALATEADVMALIERRALHGIGIGWVDAHLLASTILARSHIWTTDRPLRKVAATLEIDGSA